MISAKLADADRALSPFALDARPALAAVNESTYSNTELLRRTREPAGAAENEASGDPVFEGVDYLSLERVTRQLRSDYVTSLVSRWKETLLAALGARAVAEGGRVAKSTGTR